ncbi:MAG: autophagy protein Atg8 ubiquitin-like protein [Barrevirus sp.]|uniref:Autophagy protein Atg8 ubiquitin-like protein n=1 Tax=Barrevirus sp. TaxID=2487763 RepID=A0A3G4ZS85_9VIRU|nr:MAG: autophagy protein Atg8 ubiquitin-like protein [Barrevirus sp.]
MYKYFVKDGPIVSKSGYEFKMLHSFEKRKAEADRINEKYPDKVPLILERSDASSLPEIEKKKYLMQKDVTIGQFIFIIRKQIKMDESQSIFLLINNTVVPHTGSTIGEVYAKNVDKDGFLYITYSAQQTFG